MSTTKAVLLPIRQVVNGKKEVYLEDRNGARYEVTKDTNQRQTFFDALNRGGYVQLSLVEGEMKYSSRKLEKKDFVQFKDFPELNALRTMGPDPDDDLIRTRDHGHLRIDHHQMPFLFEQSCTHDLPSFFT